MTASVLVVDDDRTVRETLVEFFETFLWTARGATSAAEARRILEREVVDVLLLDLRLPDGDGLRVLDALRQEWPDLAVIVLTGHADIPTAVRSVQRGAIDLLEKPVDLEVLAATVRRALAIGRLQQEVEVLRARSRVVPATRSAVIGVALDASLDRAARSDAPVLLLGERGSGRGFVARVIHDRSNRASGPFIDIDCAASGTDSFITELLGDRGRGRVPGKGIRRGLLPMVGGGSLLLEQADVLVDEARHALVNALRDNGFGRPISQIGDRPAARLLASVTSADAEPSNHTLTLFGPAEPVVLWIAPLRERASELPAIARGLLPPGSRLSDDAIDALSRYTWPGNLRELEFTLWRAALLAGGDPITARHLALPGDPTVPVVPVMTLAAAEAAAIDAALTASGGNRTLAARLLGVARSTLQLKLAQREVSDLRTPSG